MSKPFKKFNYDKFELLLTKKARAEYILSCKIYAATALDHLDFKYVAKVGEISLPTFLSGDTEEETIGNAVKYLKEITNE